MTASPSQLVAGAVIAIITLALITLYRRRLAARHRNDLAAGRPFHVDAFLRGNVSPYPQQFRRGWVAIGHGVPTWKPRNFLRRRIDLPTSAVVERVRPLSFLENVSLNEDCQVIVASAGGLVIEMAVLSVELATTLRALTMATGGGWKLPAEN